MFILVEEQTKYKQFFNEVILNLIVFFLKMILQSRIYYQTTCIK